MNFDKIVPKELNEGESEEKTEVNFDFTVKKYIKYALKTKYYGCILFMMIAENNKEKKSVIGYLKIFEKDIDSYWKLKEILQSCFIQEETVVIFDKHFMKYFTLGVFPVVLFIVNQFTYESFKSTKEANKLSKSVSRVSRYLYSILKIIMESNKQISKRMINFILEKKNEFVKLFDKINTEKFSSLEEEKFQINECFKNNDGVKNTLSLASMSFTEDILRRINNFEEVQKYEDYEMKHLAKIIKSRLNLHSTLNFYWTNNNSLRNYKKLNLHLINIFLKFIQENSHQAKWLKYHIFFTKLFTKFIEVKPMYFSKTWQVAYFNKEIEDIKEDLYYLCQKIFLVNGSIEVFLKIICESHPQVIDQLYPHVTKFFINILEGGNQEAQSKFYFLFTNENSSENLFNYKAALMHKDIFSSMDNSNNSISLESDYENLNRIVNLLRFMQLLTEGHNAEMQNYIRIQNQNKISLNFISIIVEYINMLINKLFIASESTVINSNVSSLFYLRIIRCLDTLTEFLQGPCIQNQECLIDSKIIEIFDKILRAISFNANKPSDKINLNVSVDREKKLFSSLSNYEKSMMIYKVSLVLMAIIEARKPKDVISGKILRDLDYILVYTIIHELRLEIQKLNQDEVEFFLYSEEQNSENSHKIISEAGFNLFFFVCSLALINNPNSDFNRFHEILMGKSKSNLSFQFEKMTLNDLKQSIEFFETRSFHIEIVKDEDIQILFFPKLPYFKHLTEKMVLKIRERANNTSIQTKLNSLISERDEIYENLKQLETFHFNKRRKATRKVEFY